MAVVTVPQIAPFWVLRPVDKNVDSSNSLPLYSHMGLGLAVVFVDFDVVANFIEENGAFNY